MANTYMQQFNLELTAYTDGGGTLAKVPAVNISALTGVTVDDASGAGTISCGTTNGLIIGTATTQKIGFFTATPVVQQPAFTQTYATATVTHSNPTATALTDNSAGTANTTIQALADGTVYANDVAAIRNNFADLAASNNALIVDLANTKQVLNKVIDYLQAYGLFA